MLSWLYKFLSMFNTGKAVSKGRLPQRMWNKQMMKSTHKFLK